MKKLFVVEGGIGKNILFTSILRNIKEKVYVYTAYLDIYRGFENAIPLYFGAKLPEEVETIHFEPYWSSDTYYQKKHLKQIWVEGINKITGENYIATEPVLHLDFPDIQNQVENYLNILDDFIIVQFTGQQSPVNFNPNNQYQDNPKNLTLEEQKELINKIKVEFPNIKILQYGLPNEIKINGTTKFNIPYIIWFGLLKYAKTFIAIDSSLQHAAAALEKKGIVIWKQTPKKVMGWDIHENIELKCKICGKSGCWKPYLRQFNSIDNTGKIEIHNDFEKLNVDLIINKLKGILNAYQTNKI